MKRYVSNWRLRAVSALAVLVLVLLSAFVFFMAGHFKSVITEREHLAASHELELIGSLMRESLLKHDYVVAERFVTDWGKQHPEVIQLEARTANNFVLAEFSREQMPPMTLTVHRDVIWNGALLGKLEMIKDAQLVSRRLHEITFPLYLAAIVFTLTLGGAAWMLLTRIAVYPLEHEIAERQKIERELVLAKEAAEIASQAKTELQANMSHELRTPLNAIIGFSSTMKSEIFGPLNEKYLEYATDIHSSGTHLLDLINDILDVSAVEAGKMELSEENIDVGEALASTVSMVRNRADEGNVRLTSETNNRGDMLFADKRRTTQIILNLLSNAIKFTPAGGHVSITASQDELGAHVFVVADTGVGMDEQDLAKAMTRFGQVNNAVGKKHEGTGIGLPLTQGLVELHGGTFDIQSQKGKGTTVTVRFPPQRTVTA
ncbi:HAMP domain-containing sensor histidine kinase [Magnetovibrio sp.]|uniref:sensor histidine kinase n=1 Tax=Magnetovibrio sp. TaxID=2024836 RepID=UPI002F94A997